MEYAPILALFQGFEPFFKARIWIRGRAISRIRIRINPQHYLRYDAQYLERIVENPFPLLHLPLLDDHQGVLHQLPLHVHLMVARNSSNEVTFTPMNQDVLNCLLEYSDSHFFRENDRDSLEYRCTKRF